MHLKISYTVFFILNFFLIYGQGIHDIKFQSLNVNDGLPNNTVNDFKTDRHGFLWIATNEGLCRYDSPNNFTVIDNDAFGLSSNQVRCISISDDDHIWIGTRKGGLSRYNAADGSFKSYTVENSELSHNDIVSLYEDEESNLWIGTEDGLNIYNLSSDSWTKYAYDESSSFGLHSKAVLSVASDNKGWKWLGTWGGSFYLVLNSGESNNTPLKFRKFSASKDPNATNVWRVFQDSKDRYWIATHNGGLFLMQIPAGATNALDKQDWEPVFHNYTGTLKDRTNLTSNYIYDINEDNDGNLWLACIQGLNIVNEAQMRTIGSTPDSINKPDIKFTNILYDKNLKGSINNSNIYKIYKDENEMMWFGSSSGINMFSTRSSKFKEFDLNRYGNEFSNSNVSSLVVDNRDNVWLGTEANGLLFYNKIENTVIKAKEKLNRKLPENIYSLEIIGDSLLIGSGTSLGVFDILTNKYVDYSIPQQFLKDRINTFNRNILIDSKKRVWLGSEHGLGLFNSDFSFINFFTTNPDDSLSISDNSITDIFEDSNYTIWIATYNGLNKLIPENDTYHFNQIKTGSIEDDFNISSNQVTSINEYKDLIYFGSQNGVFTYHTDSDKFEMLDIINKNNNIFNIEITSSGYFWAVNSDGLLAYDIENKNLSYFEKDEQLGDLADQLNSSYTTENDKILFSLRNGFVIKNNEDAEENNTHLPVYITEVSMLGTNGEKRTKLLHKQEINVLPSVYHLSFNYAALNYNHPKDNLYAYKLDGFEDSEWKYMNVNSPIVFTNLDPGTYTLYVKASNNEGEWNEIGDSIQVNIIPAIYQTISFKLFSILFLIGLIYFTVKYYIRNILMRNEQLKQEISDRILAEAALLDRDIKMKVLLSELDKSNSDLERSNKDLEQFAYIASHDLKEPLRTIGTFTDLLKHKFESNLNDSGKKYIYFITDGVHRMSSLINSLLTYSRAGQEFKEMEIVDLTEMLQDVLKDLSIIIKEKNVTVVIDELPSIFCSRDQISMLFSNLILNGIKFNTSSQPQINVTFSEMEDYWQFSVKDNGIGIAEEYQEQIFEIFKRLHSKQEYEGTGIGLALCKRIVETHSGSIWIESIPEKCSEFHFTIAKVIDSVETDERAQKNKKLKEEIETLLNS